MKKWLTVVVPSYNAEKYLKHNLDSLCLAEVLEDLEIIAVDDGSTDTTGKIIDEYAEKYPDTVVPVHKENGGHGSGINAGIKNATGKYFRVMDADDWADGEDLKELIKYIKNQETEERYNGRTQGIDECSCVRVSLRSDEEPESLGYDEKSCETDTSLENTEADIIAGGFYWVYGHDDTAPKKTEFDKPFEGVQYGHVYRFDDIAEKAYIKMHSMTIRTEILKKQDIKIDEHCYYVDTEYILYPIPYVETVVFLDDHLYRYSISREGQSMSPQQMMKNKVQYDKVLQSLYVFYSKVLEMEDISDGKRIYIEHLISRVYASRIKILLWDKICSDTRKELIEMEEGLKKKYPGIYNSNLNKGVKMLRASGYLLYYPAALIRRFWIKQ